jgi:hypothetical protein
MPHTHILNNRHEYGTTNDTLKLIQPCRKSMKMNHWENMYIQIYGQQDQLITEQQINELNPLYELAQLPHTLQNSSQTYHQQTRTPNMHSKSGLLQIKCLTFRILDIMNIVEIILRNCCITDDIYMRPHTA